MDGNDWGGGGHTGRPVWIVLSGDTEDAAGRVGGCQSGKGASSLSSLFHALAPLFPPSTSLLPRLCPAVSGSSWEYGEGK